MKKLIMIVAIICAAVAANAAAINWNSGTIYVASDADGTTGSGTSYKAGLLSSGRMVTAYLYEFATESLYAAAKASTVETLYADYVKSGISTTVDPVTSKGNGAANITQTVGDASGAHYGMIIYTDTDNINLGDSEAFVKVSFGIAQVDGATTVTVGNMALTTGGATSVNWTAISAGTTPVPPDPSDVPEPTSALLLAVGGAALALRRKQK